MQPEDYFQKEVYKKFTHHQIKHIVCTIADDSNKLITTLLVLKNIYIIMEINRIEQNTSEMFPNEKLLFNIDWIKT